MEREDANWLLLDSSGVIATLAIGKGTRVRAQCELAGRAFSAEWRGALRALLQQTDLDVSKIGVVGVVGGPGSFTGVRVGLAAAKGLCEASGAELVSISRLEIIASMASEPRVAVMDAGRGEWYVRRGAQEMLSNATTELESGESRYVTTDAAVVQAMAGRDAIVVTMSGISSLPIFVDRLRSARFDNVASTDANYVRGERDIYAKKPA